MTWYIAVNTFHPGNGLGTVISSHRSMAAAHRACQSIQPPVPRGRQRQLGDGYVPTDIRVSTTRLSAGSREALSDLARVPDDEYAEFQYQLERDFQRA